MTRIILDTGSLVAYLRKSDHRHDWAKAQFQRILAPFWTCEPVLTEAAFLLNPLAGPSSKATPMSPNSPNAKASAKSS